MSLVPWQDIPVLSYTATAKPDNPAMSERNWQDMTVVRYPLTTELENPTTGWTAWQDIPVLRHPVTVQPSYRVAKRVTRAGVLAWTYQVCSGKGRAMLTQEAKDLFSKLDFEIQPVALKYCFSQPEDIMCAVMFLAVRLPVREREGELRDHGSRAWDEAA